MIPSELLILKFLATYIKLSFSMGLDWVDFKMSFLLYEPYYLQSSFSGMLKHLLDLCKELNISISKVVVDDDVDINKLKNIEQKYPTVYKVLTVDKKSTLSMKDLYDLAEENYKNAPYYPSIYDTIIYNLFFVLKFSDTRKDALQIIESKIRNLMERFLTESEIPGEYNFNLYTYRHQKANFLKNIPALYDQLGRDFWIVNLEHYKVFGEEYKKVRFLETILGLELEGYFTITKVQLRAAKLKDKKKQIQVLALQIHLNPEKFQSVERLQGKEEIKTFPPFGWSLNIDGKSAHIIRNHEEVFTFPNILSNRFRYFEYLWSNYAQHIDYKDIYEYKSKQKYPEKGHVWKVNKEICNVFYKLQKDPDFQKLSIKISVERGLRLTISAIPILPAKTTKKN